MATPKLDRQSCPLCGAANDCALASDPSTSVTECWCVDEGFSSALLGRLPPEEFGVRCICRKCVQRSGEARPN